MAVKHFYNSLLAVRSACVHSFKSISLAFFIVFYNTVAKAVNCGKTDGLFNYIPIKLFKPFFHVFCGRAAVCHGQYFVRRYSGFTAQVCSTRGDYGCFSRTWAGKNKGRSVFVSNGLSLLIVKPNAKLFFQCLYKIHHVRLPLLYYTIFRAAY